MFKFWLGGPGFDSIPAIINKSSSWFNVIMLSYFHCDDEIGVCICNCHWQSSFGCVKGEVEECLNMSGGGGVCWVMGWDVGKRLCLGV